MRTIRNKKVLPDGSIRITEYVYPTGYKGKSTTANSISKSVYTIPAADVTVSTPRTVAAARSGSRPDLVGPTPRKPSKTYVTKSGELRQYYYDPGKSHRGKTFVSANGRINRKNIDAYKADIDASDELNQAQKRALKADLDDLVERRSHTGQKLTSTGFEGTQARNKATRFFANAGQSVKDVAKEINVDPNTLINDNNWNGMTFSGKDRAGNDVTYQFHWGYRGNLWKRVV